MKKTTGGCLCGSVRYEIEGEPFRVAVCHCDDCRKVTGSAFATNIFYQEEQITLLQGEPKRFEHVADTGNSMFKEFCPNCGSQVFGGGALRKGVKSVKVGSLDDPSFVKPEVNLFAPRTLRYVHIEGDLENFDAMPPPA